MFVYVVNVEQNYFISDWITIDKESLFYGAHMQDMRSDHKWLALSIIKENDHCPEFIDRKTSKAEVNSKACPGELRKIHKIVSDDF